MAGLHVKRLFALGESQSASRLLSYANGIQPLGGPFSAIILGVSLGHGTDFDDFVFDPAKSLAENNDRRRAAVLPTKVRDDLKTPVMMINSETETLYVLPTRQPDSPWFRCWEVVGAVHASAAGGGRRPDINARDGLPPQSAVFHSKMVDLLPSFEAACVDLIRWLDTGEPPPGQRRIEVAGAPPAVQRDADGNSLGGMRLPEIAVPAATFDTDHPPGGGTRRPFPPERLRALYPTTDIYVEKATAAANKAVREGLILPRRAREYVEAARQGPETIA